MADVEHEARIVRQLEQAGFQATVLPGGHYFVTPLECAGELESLAQRRACAQRNLLSNLLGITEIEQWIKTCQGVDGVAYQRSAQIQWWSILQGIAVGALISRFDGILDKVFINHELFLIVYFVSSFVIIVNSWVQMAWAILISRWRITLVHTALILMLGIAISGLCLQVDTPLNWHIALAFVILSAVIVYVYNIRNRTQVGLSTQRVEFIISIYVFFLLMDMIAIFHLISDSSHLTRTIWSFVFFIVSCASLVIQHVQMNYERIERNVP